MNDELKKFLDDSCRNIEESLGNPEKVDCFIIYKEINEVNSPIAIFGTKERLYEKFEDVVSSVDSNEMSSLGIGGWQFD